MRGRKPVDAGVFAGLAICGVLALNACSGATSSPPIATPAATVCSAILAASRGEWTQAEMDWITAESTPGESASAVAAFLQLGNAAGTIAHEQAAGIPTAADIATYKSEFTSTGAFTSGC